MKEEGRPKKKWRTTLRGRNDEPTCWSCGRQLETQRPTAAAYQRPTSGFARSKPRPSAGSPLVGRLIMSASGSGPRPISVEPRLLGPGRCRAGTQRRDGRPENNKNPPKKKKKRKEIKKQRRNDGDDVTATSSPSPSDAADLEIGSIAERSIRTMVIALVNPTLSEKKILKKNWNWIDRRKVN